MIFYVRKILLGVIGAIVVYLLANGLYENSYHETIYTDNGEVRFSTEQLESFKVLQLQEQWRFVPFHAAPDEIQHAATQSIQMPFIERGLEKGTFALSMQLPEANQLYSLQFNSYADELAIWVNEKLIAQRSGTRSTNPIIFYAEEKDVQLVIQSTSDIHNISVVETPVFGAMEQVRGMKNRDYAFSVFVASIFLILSVYSLIVYFRQDRDLFFFHVALYFILISIVLTLAGEKVILDLIPYLQDSIRIKLKLIFMLLGTIPLLIIIHSLQLVIIRKSMFIIHIILVCCIACSILLLPSAMYFRLEDMFFVYTIVVLAIILCILIWTMTRSDSQSIELYYVFMALVYFVVYILFHIYRDVFGSDLINEIWMLLHLFYLFRFLSIRMKNLQRELERTKYDAIQSKISFLSMQIKPHFIYNSIANIIALCYTEPRKAAKLLGSFSTYLRLIFDNNGPELYSSIEKELQLIDAYTEIEQARFPGKIHYYTSVEPQLMKSKIPALTLQPFVENAIRHGLFHKPDGVEVRVVVKQEWQTMTILISDNGIGMSAEKLEEILRFEATDAGIGVQNVMQRLAFMNRGDLSIESQVNEGTTVRIVISLDQI